MPQDIHSMLFLITGSLLTFSYHIRTDLSLELHVDATLTSTNLDCGRCFASHAIASEANMVLTLEACFYWLTCLVGSYSVNLFHLLCYWEGLPALETVSPSGKLPKWLPSPLFILQSCKILTSVWFSMV